MPYCDEHKKASYLMKWIVKTKPIHMVIKRSQTDEDPAYSAGEAFANEIYAIWLGFTELSVSYKKIPLHYTRNLVYLLHYHSVDADFLASEMFLLDMSYAPRYKQGDIAPEGGYYAELSAKEEKLRFWGFKKGDSFPSPEQRGGKFKLVAQKSNVASGPLNQRPPGSRAMSIAE